VIAGNIWRKPVPTRASIVCGIAGVIKFSQFGEYVHITKTDSAKVDGNNLVRQNRLRQCRMVRQSRVRVRVSRVRVRDRVRVDVHLSTGFSVTYLLWIDFSIPTEMMICSQNAVLLIYRVHKMSCYIPDLLLTNQQSREQILSRL